MPMAVECHRPSGCPNTATITRDLAASLAVEGITPKLPSRRWSKANLWPSSLLALRDDEYNKRKEVRFEKSKHDASSYHQGRRSHSSAHLRVRDRGSDHAVAGAAAPGEGGRGVRT